MDSLVSVIIPVYNRQSSVERCVKSVIEQTYRFFEIIIVDDGSYDNSAMICDALCEKYLKSGYNIYVIHKSNGGVSSARNKGIDFANGRYIVFIDSDDTVTNTYLSDFVELQESGNRYGNVSCAFKSLNVTGLEYAYSKDEQISVCERNDYTKMSKKFQVQSPWLRLYKTEVIKRNDIRMKEYVSNGEDLMFNLEYFDALGNVKIAILNKANYLYEDGSDSSLNWKYRPNLLSEYTEINNTVKYYLQKWDAFSGQSKVDYYESAFYRYRVLLDNTFNKNNKSSFFCKLSYNNKILKSAEFKEVLDNSTKHLNKIAVFSYKSGNYLTIIFIKKINAMTGFIKKILKKAGKVFKK